MIIKKDTQEANNSGKHNMTTIILAFICAILVLYIIYCIMALNSSRKFIFQKDKEATESPIQTNDSEKNIIQNVNKEQSVEEDILSEPVDSNFGIEEELLNCIVNEFENILDNEVVLTFHDEYGGESFYRIYDSFNKMVKDEIGQDTPEYSISLFQVKSDNGAMKKEYGGGEEYFEKDVLNYQSYLGTTKSNRGIKYKVYSSGHGSLLLLPIELVQDNFLTYYTFDDYTNEIVSF